MLAIHFLHISNSWTIVKHPQKLLLFKNYIIVKSVSMFLFFFLFLFFFFFWSKAVYSMWKCHIVTWMGRGYWFYSVSNTHCILPLETGGSNWAHGTPSLAPTAKPLCNLGQLSASSNPRSQVGQAWSSPSRRKWEYYHPALFYFYHLCHLLTQECRAGQNDVDSFQYSSEVIWCYWKRNDFVWMTRAL